MRGERANGALQQMSFFFPIFCLDLQNQQLPCCCCCCCCEYYLTLEDRYIVFMFAADLPSSSSSSYSSSVEAEKKVTANLLVQYLFVCCFVSFWDILVG